MTTPLSEIPALLVEAAGRLAALPLDGGVREVLRPRPLVPLPDAPPGVVGAARIRGRTVPVVRLAALLGGHEPTPGRLVLVTRGERAVGLEVDAVRGVVPLAPEPLPALLSSAAPGVVQAMAERDREFVLWLEAARLLPEGAP